MMMELIVLALIAALFTITVLLKRTGRRDAYTPREAALTETALAAHIRAQAAMLTIDSRVTQEPDATAAIQLREAYSACAALAGAVTLTPASQWLCDNARLLEEAAVSMDEALRQSPPLPACKGVPRVTIIARELIAHSDARVDLDMIVMATRAFEQACQLTEDELWALPLAMRRELVLLAAEVANGCVSTERSRLAARGCAQNLTQTPPERPSRKFTRAARGSAFLEQLLTDLLEREDAAGLAWMDAYLTRRGDSAELIIENEHTRQTRVRDWMGNAVTSLRALNALNWDAAQEALSAVHGALSQDPAKVYRRMDFSSRCMYRARVAKLARLARSSEIAVARHALSLAKEGCCGVDPDDAPVDSPELITGHVGYYLIDDGQSRLWKVLGGAPIGARIARLLQRRAAGLAIGAICLLDIALAALALHWGAPWWAALIGLPLLGEASRIIVHKAVLRFTPPRALPRIAPEHLGDRRTLVVVPTLLSNRQQALDMARHLSVLRFANPQEGVDFMLLADFTDSDAAETVGDASITEAASEAIGALNQVWGGGYLYIHRKRKWDAGMRRFMGPDRKRGALESLNAWIVDGADPDTADSLAVFNVEPSALLGRYRTVVTLDADTQLPPDSVLTFTGALAHPLNKAMPNGLGGVSGKPRGYSILQPRMEVAASTVRTRVSRLYGGDGGVDLYVTAASEFYQNLAGSGSFAGKGAYDPAAFHRAVKGRVRKGTILSHDLLEGELSRSALVCDVPLYDGQPGSVSSWMKRNHRWIRGDWQLLPWLMPRVMGENGTFKNPLGLLSRFKIYDNLRRSLLPPLELALWITGFALGSWPVLLMAVLPSRLGSLLRPTLKTLASLGARLAALPLEARSQLDAVIRTIWRVCVSHRNMLEWVTSADAEKASPGSKDPANKSAGASMPRSWPCWVSAAACVAGAAYTVAAAYTVSAGYADAARDLWYLIGAISLAAAWLTAPKIIEALDERLRTAPSLEQHQRGMLQELGRETWSFFETVVNSHSHYLPPDNLQTDPPRGAAPRTSPTNIGMYLLACAGAKELGFIDATGFLDRVTATLTTLESLETWRGHPYNWYDTRTLEPLRPRYISSVDSGNYAVCLTAVAQAVRQALAESRDMSNQFLPSRLDALVDNIQFQALYDPSVSLFYVGVDAETGMPGGSHYDLLASEARMLSYLAVMRREAPLKHWRALGRTMTDAHAGPALLSWAGTAFEYLMPLLLLPDVPMTLLGQSSQSAVRAQISAAKGHPWGISESGFWAFDPELNYQYRAFGVPELSLRGGAMSPVVAPYASALALAVQPRAAAENIARMRRMGWADEHGMFEAADYDQTRMPEDCAVKLVSSHMAHHQGMILCAIVNALCDNALAKMFSALPQAEAYALLLEEKIPTRRMLAKAVKPRYHAAPQAPRGARRIADAQAWPVATHLMHGAGTTWLRDAHGNGYIAHQGVMLTRWRPDPTMTDNGVQFYLRASEGGAVVRMGGAGGESVFDTGSVEWSAHVDSIDARLTMGVSPLAGAAVALVKLRNHGSERITVEITSFAEVALSAQAADVAHPAFRNLFVETARPEPRLLTAKRRPRGEREEAERTPMLAHFVSSDAYISVTAQTDRRAFLGRDGTIPAALLTPAAGGSNAAVGVSDDRSSDKPTVDAPSADAAFQRPGGTVGAVVDPCVSLTARLTLEPEQEARLAFGFGAVDREEDAPRLAARFGHPDAAEHALQLSVTQAEVTARHLNLDAAQQNAAQSLASYLLYNGQPAGRAEALARNAQGVSGIWALGLSGDLPILTVTIGRLSETPLARALLRAHEYLRRLGLWFDLVLLAKDGEGYNQPIRDALREAVAASSARDLLGKTSGAHLPDAALMNQEMLDTLYASSALTLRGESGSLTAQLAALRVNPRREWNTPTVMTIPARGMRGKRGDWRRMSARRTEQHMPPIMSLASARKASAEALPRRDFASGYPIIQLKPNGPLTCETSYGGFDVDGAYVIKQEATPPAPWSNALANPAFGTLITDRGDGFTWVGNSNMRRITPFANDAVRGRVGEAVYLRDEDTGAFISSTPAPCGAAARVTHGRGYTLFESSALGIGLRFTVFTDSERPVGCRLLQLRNPGNAVRHISVTAYARWAYRGDGESRLLTTGVSDIRSNTATSSAPGESYTAAWARHPSDRTYLYLTMPGQTVVSSTVDALAFLGTGGTTDPRGMNVSPSAPPRGSARLELDNLGGELPCAVLRVLITIEPGEEAEVCVLIGASDSPERAAEDVQLFANPVKRLDLVRAAWRLRLGGISVKTPDPAINLMLGQWLPYQTTASRLWARAGFYQAGGAIGFRDQLQDMLALIDTRPAEVREHILVSASHQFESGDVQHWWHPPALGVRTKLSDDKLFLPYMVAEYVETTGDNAILKAERPYLKDHPIAEGSEDYYGEGVVSERMGTILEHGLRALDSVRLGPHGIPLMGAGDWNDAMNRVGINGRGESVWLGFFYVLCLRRFAALCEESTAKRLNERADHAMTAIENSGWDGEWYRRAWFDDGKTLGSAESPECRIDCIAQSWSAIAGADRERSEQAVQSALERLYDADLGIMRLLAPPFNGVCAPGYIRGYLPGVRENGGQYTHGAAWMTLALSRLGHDEAAWALYSRLLPTAHTRTDADVRKYGAEPYVVAADIYANPQQMGRGGWTWYTGAAAWLYWIGIHALLGFEKRGDRVRLKPTAPPSWDRYEVVYRWGTSAYHLQGRRSAEYATLDGERMTDPEGWVELRKDGRAHLAVYPLKEGPDEQANVYRALMQLDTIYHSSAPVPK
jgi:cyclic beta-1,2-glucan synthetase